MPPTDAAGFLGRVHEADRAALLDAGRRRSMSSGELLFREGDDAYEVLILLSGIVKVWVTAGSGRVVILDVMDGDQWWASFRPSMADRARPTPRP